MNIEKPEVNSPSLQHILQDAIDNKNMALKLAYKILEINQILDVDMNIDRKDVPVVKLEDTKERVPKLRIDFNLTIIETAKALADCMDEVVELKRKLVDRPAQEQGKLANNIIGGNQ
jgi:hypothetical protein